MTNYCDDKLSRQTYLVLLRPLRHFIDGIGHARSNRTQSGTRWRVRITTAARYVFREPRANDPTHGARSRWLLAESDSSRGRLVNTAFLSQFEMYIPYKLAVSIDLKWTMNVKINAEGNCLLCRCAMNVEDLPLIFIRVFFSSLAIFLIPIKYNNIRCSMYLLCNYNAVALQLYCSFEFCPFCILDAVKHLGIMAAKAMKLAARQILKT